MSGDFETIILRLLFLYKFELNWEISQMRIRHQIDFKIVGDIQVTLMSLFFFLLLIQDYLLYLLLLFFGFLVNRRLLYQI